MNAVREMDALIEIGAGSPCGSVSGLDLEMNTTAGRPAVWRQVHESDNCFEALGSGGACAAEFR